MPDDEEADASEEKEDRSSKGPTWRSQGLKLGKAMFVFFGHLVLTVLVLVGIGVAIYFIAVAIFEGEPPRWFVWVLVPVTLIATWLVHSRMDRWGKDLERRYRFP